MIERLTYVNERGDSIEFSIKSPYRVNISKDVTGLSDVTNDIYTINAMGQDGDTYLGNRIEPRHIEIVGYVNNTNKETAQRLKREMNRILNPQFTALLVYRFGDHVRVIGATIDNAPLFVAAPVLEQFTIQLTCTHPFWREENDRRQDIATWVGLMEFKIRPEDDQPHGLEIPIEGWEIGKREPSLIVNLFNAGDVRAGMTIEFRALGRLLNPMLLNVATGLFLRIRTEMLAGDVITVHTGYGEKGITLTRGGVVSNIFSELDPDSSYLKLEVGDNIFRYDADENMASLDVVIHHNNFFLGV